MKLAVMGDLHITNKKPQCRTDNYYHTLLNKFGFILTYCHRNKIDFLIQPGDFFDSHTMSYEVTGDINAVLGSKRHRINVLGVYGQHDLRFHSLDTANTPLRLLETSGTFTRLLPDKPYSITTADEHICIWGRSWGEDMKIIPEPEAVNILAVHTMVIDSEKLWSEQKEYTLATHLLRESRCDLVVCGDNHTSFTSQHVGRKLVNCGSMMRSSVAQAKHLPHFYVYDTVDKSLDRVLIPIRPFGDVATITAHEEKKASSAEVEKFIENIGKGTDFTMDFKANVFQMLKDEGAEESLIKEVDSIFRAIESTNEWSERQVLKRYNINIDEEIDNGHGQHPEAVDKIKRFHRGRQEGEESVRGGDEDAPETTED